MKQLMSFSQNNPVITIGLLFLLTVLAATQLDKLRFDIAAQSMMVKTDDTWKQYQKSLDNFGNDNTVIIYIHDQHLLSHDKLTLIETALKQFEALPFVQSSQSLFNIANVKEVDDYVVSDPFLKTIPTTEADFKQLLNEAKANPLVLNNFISADGQSMAINLSINSSAINADADQIITDQLNNVISELKPSVDNIFQMGAAFVRNETSKQIKLDQNTLAPAALICLILVLALSLKHINYAVVPVLTAGISIVITLAVMAIANIPINILTSIVPALILIIGSTEDIHLMTEYQLGINQGQSRQQAVALLANNQSLAITLTFITTFIGFLSITINDLDMLSQFGWVVSFGLLLNFLVTALFVPAYLQLLGSRKAQHSKQRNLYQNLARSIFKIVITYKQATVIFITILSLVFIWGSQYVQINNNTIEFFPKQSTVYQNAETLHKNLAGMQSFNIILESNIEGTFEKVRYLEDINRLQDYLKNLGVFDTSSSFSDFMMLTNKVMEGVNDLALPSEDQTVQAYIELTSADLYKSYVTEDYSTARILVRHHISSSNELKKHLEQIQSFIEQQLNSPLNIYFTGESILTNSAADEMAISQIQSLLLMVVVIFLLVSILFIDIRAGILALIPNIFPVIVLFGVMGYFHIPLDTGTTMVAIIALGICVDDTIHFLSRYHHFTRGTSNVEAALLKTAQHEATPISTTSIALAAGFATLSLSSFQPVVNFGALSALVMLTAMFSTFILTPILLSFTRLITAWDMLNLKLQSSVMNKSEFFRGLKPYEIKKAILSGTIINFEKDDIIIEQGEFGTEFYVILEGSVAITHKDTEGSIHTLNHLKSGDMFGEVAQLTGQNRSARVTTSIPSKLLRVEWDSLYQLGRFHPRVSLKLYRNMSTTLGKRMAQQAGNSSQIKDELTGAVTKNFLLEQLVIELKRTQRYQESLSCIMLDIDFLSNELKSFTQNQLELPLKDLTRIISIQTRNVDVFARWNTYQFIIVMPRTNNEKALLIMDRIRNTIEQNDSLNIGRIHLSATISQSNVDDTVDTIINRLEESIEQLKTHGKSLQIAIV